MKENLFYGIKKTAVGFTAVELSKEEFRMEERVECPMTFDYGAHFMWEMSDSGSYMKRGQVIFYKGNTMEEFDGVRNGWAMDVARELWYYSSVGKYSVKIIFVDGNGDVVKKTFSAYLSDMGRMLVEIFTFWYNAPTYINARHLNLVESLDLENYRVYNGGDYDYYLGVYNKCWDNVYTFVPEYESELSRKMISELEEKLATIKSYINERWPENKI